MFGPTFHFKEKRSKKKKLGQILPKYILNNINPIVQYLLVDVYLYLKSIIYIKLKLFDEVSNSFKIL